MKAIWKGYVKFSLVTIPVKMYNAVSRKTVTFDLLHKDCGTKIKQERLCPHCDKVLSQDELIRGYKYGKDLYITVTDEDLHQARKESTDTIEILKFVDEREIHPIYYADSHYLVPDGKAGAEAFALFHRALIDLQKSALAKVVMRNREHLFSIRPYNGALIAFTLHFPEEIVDVARVEEAEEVQKVQVEEKGVGLAKTVIDYLSGHFVPEEYTDEYTQTLLQIIRARAEGEEFRVEVKEEKEKVINLMEALQKSVAESAKLHGLPKKGMATAGRRPMTAKRKQKRG